MCGLLPALLLLPNLHVARWERALPIAGALATVALFVGLGVHVYVTVLPGACCKPGCGP